MSILAKVRCKTGLHSGTWSHPGARCEMVRVCDACGKVEEKPHHVWGQFGYLDAGRCDQTRRCDRCGSTETRSRHEWGPWTYVNTEFNSPQAHTCRRCRLTERTAYTMR
jgi:hypothetical protein